MTHQLDRAKYSENLRSPTTPAVEQVLRGEASRWSLNISPNCHDMEDDHGYHPKKSVLAKVKEKAKKWKHSLSIKKRHVDDGSSTTPSWGVSLDDDHFEDSPQQFVTPKGRPETYKEHAKQINPKADSLFSEKRVINHGISEKEKGKAKLIISPHESVTDETTTDQKMASPPKQITAGSDEIVKKIQGLTVSTQTETNDKHTTDVESKTSLPIDKKVTLETDKDVQAAVEAIVKTEDSVSEKPAASFITGNINEAEVVMSPGKQVWEKGIAMKEYIMNKLEPGEDERALSQVIVEAISPRRNPGDASVVDKVKDAVTSLIWTDQEPPQKSNLAHVPVTNTVAAHQGQSRNPNNFC